MKIQVPEKDGMKVFLSRYCVPEWVEITQCGVILVDLLSMIVLNSGTKSMFHFAAKNLLHRQNCTRLESVDNIVC